MHRLRNPWEWLTWGATAFAMLLCFWGKIQHFWALLIFLVPWAHRFYFSQVFRNELNELKRKLWQSSRGLPPVPKLASLARHSGFCGGTSGSSIPGERLRERGGQCPRNARRDQFGFGRHWELSEFVGRPAEYPYLGLLQRTNKGIYSAYPSGPVQFALPVVLASKFLGRGLPKVFRSTPPAQMDSILALRGVPWLVLPDLPASC